MAADPSECSFQFNPIGTASSLRARATSPSSCLAQSSVSYDNVAGAAGTPATIKIGDKVIESPAGNVAKPKFDEAKQEGSPSSRRRVAAALKAAGYPAKADPAKINKPHGGRRS